MVRTAVLIVSLVSICGWAQAEHEGARRVKFLSYPDCIELRNPGGTVVVLCHQVGGRVLSYSHQGKESLYISPKEKEWVAGGKLKPTSAGRFDIGPEYLIPKRPELWNGEWQAEIIGPRAARLTSQPSPGAGVRLVREFRLAADSSSLECKQIIENTSGEVQSWCHWGRMFAIHGGIGIVPLTPERQRFPEGYIMMRGRDEMLINPEDKNIRRRGDFLEILGPPAEPKLGFDSFAGWFAYQMPNDLAFVKTYETYPDSLYGEIAGLTISIWYPEADRIPACELEPIGPMETLLPGARASFTENWHLIPNRFPPAGEELDIGALVRKASEVIDWAPRWSFAGDDVSLALSFDEADDVVMVCVTGTELKDVEPPFATVIYHATVTEVLKGARSVGERVRLRIGTDGLPEDEGERKAYIDARDQKGRLMFAFLEGDEDDDGEIWADWTLLPEYDLQMHRFLKRLTERGGTPRPPSGE